MVTFAGVVVNAAFYVAAIVALVCIGCGLYYVSELSEGNTVLTRKLLRAAIYLVWAALGLLFFVDGLPWWACGTSFGAHAAYYALVQSFPFVALASPQAVLSIVGFLSSHLVWYLHFVDLRRGPVHTYPQLLGFFFLIVWLVPFSLVITLSIDGMALPGAGSIDGRGGNLLGGGKRTTAAHYIANFLRPLGSIGSGKRRDVRD
eukprot:TRINITY_DN93098_c0_g1_i1.p1 TRINITY_DN93098_c0_g1~~TRINITY_DN93098_c0_g1_i1.p1  ORF type:complete len:210 (+),score=24.83 TRINITY_DN93098_c0_g1_i1:22-630(+)